MKYDFPLSTEVTLNLEPFMKPASKAGPHAFFLCSVRFGREIVELLDRADYTWNSITYDRSWDVNKWGFGDFYDARGGIWDFEIILKNFEEMMLSDECFDVLIIPSVNGWSAFTSETRKAILQRVENGAGLILVQPFDGKLNEKTDELAALTPLFAKYEEQLDKRGYAKIAFETLKSEKWLPKEHSITKGIPFELMPYDNLAYYPYSAAHDAKIILESETKDPIAAIKTVGKGRVVAFGYFRREILPQNKDFVGKDACFNPITDTWLGAITDIGFDFLEYFYRFFHRAVLWAAKMQPEGISDCTLHNGQIKVDAADDVFLSVKNHFDGKLINNYKIPVGEFANLPSEIDCGGTFRADISLCDKNGTLDFYTKVFTLPMQAEIKSISLSPDIAREGDAVEAALVSSGKADSVNIYIKDGYGRILGQTTEAFAEKITVSFKVKNTLSIHLFVEAELVVGNYIADKRHSSNTIITPQKRGLDDFEVFMNPQNRGHGDLMPFVNKLFPQIGMTGNFIGDNRLVAMSGGYGLGVYWYDRAPYVENKEKYLRTKDKAYLIRTPCLNDSSFWDKNREAIEKNVGNYKKYGPIAYFAQDEGSLTCYTDELDLCFCPNCISLMQVWLKEEYKTIEKLNKSWGTSYTRWEEAIPITLIEARNANNYAPWADHRRFMELTYANSYKNFSSMIKSVDEGGRVRMSGCQSSTAYSGNDYDLLHQHVRYFEAYPVGNQYEYHRSFKADETILGGWFGYGASGVSVQKNIWYALYHGLTLISIFWEYACLNHDFTFSNSALSMSVAFKEIRREGIGKMLLYTAKQNNLGIAVHYSMSSVHGTAANGHEDDFEKNRQGWLHLLEDLGYQYQFISSSKIEEGALEQGIKLLILPYSIAISEQEAMQIQKFTELGGLVIADVQTGIMDGHCARLDHGCLDELLGIERLTTDFERFYVCDGFSANPEFQYFNYELKHTPGKEDIGPGVSIAELGTRAKGGQAAYVDGFMNKVASVVVNETGKGKAVYLNFSLKDYPYLRTSKNGGAGVRDIIRNIINLSSVQKPVELLCEDGTPLECGIESFYYQLGDDSVFCMQKTLSEQVEVNYDGLTINREDERELEKQGFTIKLPKKKHIYNIRTKRYLGFTDTAGDSITEGDTNLYTVLDYKAEKLTLHSPSIFHPTEAFILKGSLEITGKAPKQSVFAINIYTPDGEFSSYYSSNVSANGTEFTCSIPFPLNMDKGRWKIFVKDVATSCHAETVIEVV